MSNLSQIRSTFINYFKDRGHEEIKSSSLIPSNDPTLMFTNSGMVQFKNVFTGDETRDIPRAVSSQKCVRAGGKHNDLDNVGYTARHHTFFEMLGNFSFGDYFKEEAIPLAWDLVTKHFNLPKDKLLVTVFHDDEEAASIWKKYAGLNDNQIIKISTSDNFWSMGATGPCGPCSEIFYDHGPGVKGGRPGSKNEDGDRFVEIWNLVFMQFYQFEDGRREKLPKPSIDTGMGLERIAAILQGKQDNYDTDLIRALIDRSADLSSTDADGAEKIHHRVITDHLRSASFLISDGILPSSDGRGYVLRRILRRAMRHANLMNISEPFIYKLVDKLVDLMGAAYPELRHSQTLISQTIKSEENKFIKTLSNGIGVLEAEISNMGAGSVLDGRVAFKLYDTYGFPLDLTEDALREKGFTVDRITYDKEMELQRVRARSTWSGTGDVSENKEWLSIFENSQRTDFLGYDQMSSEGLVIALVCNNSKVDRITKGEKGQLLCNQTPFFGESGGQIGDIGFITSVSGKAKVESTKNIKGFIIHIIDVNEGEILLNQTVKLFVDERNRNKIRANHSATHLLHEALRNNLGQHIEQRGSLNSNDRLRFDFSHDAPLSSIELKNIQNEVNNLIRENSKVETNILDLDQAKKLGARALFGEKYDDDVRVVSMGAEKNSGRGLAGNSYSVELCGGTHVNSTGDIGYFTIISETASASGIRRVEALTGSVAVDYVTGMVGIVNDLCSYLKAKPHQILDRVTNLLEDRKSTQVEISNLKIKLNSGANKSEQNLHSDFEINGIKVLVKQVEDLPVKDIRSLLDQQKKGNLKSLVIIFSTGNDKVMIATGVTSDLTQRLSAIDIAKIASQACGGKGGGGRTDFAQAGGSDPSKIPQALQDIKSYLSNK